MLTQRFVFWGALGLQVVFPVWGLAETRTSSVFESDPVLSWSTLAVTAVIGLLGLVWASQNLFWGRRPVFPSGRNRTPRFKRRLPGGPGPRNERLSALGRLVIGVSHKLSTPLGNLLTVTTLMEDRLDELDRLSVGCDGPQVLEFLHRNLELLKKGIGYQKSTVLQTIELINRFKQIDVFRHQYTLHPFPLELLFHDLRVYTLDRLKGLSLSLRFHGGEGVCLTSSEEALLQVIYALVENCAMHAYPDISGGIVDLRVQVCKREVLFWVEDFGQGIAEPTRETIFDPFYTTALNKGSGGLGLTICKSLVREVLGGDLTLVDKEGPGCLFLVRMERIEGEPKKTTPGKAPKKSSPLE